MITQKNKKQPKTVKHFPIAIPEEERKRVSSEGFAVDKSEKWTSQKIVQFKPQILFYGNFSIILK
jgi:hypothetical protein